MIFMGYLSKDFIIAFYLLKKKMAQIPLVEAGDIIAAVFMLGVSCRVKL